MTASAAERRTVLEIGSKEKPTVGVVFDENVESSRTNLRVLIRRFPELLSEGKPPRGAATATISPPPPPPARAKSPLSATGSIPAEGSDRSRGVKGGKGKWEVSCKPNYTPPGISSHYLYCSCIYRYYNYQHLT